MKTPLSDRAADWRLTHIVLAASTLFALGFCLVQAQENRKMSRILKSFGGTLSGPAKAIAGDLVPPFTATDLNGEKRTIAYDNETSQCRILQIFSPDCGACRTQLDVWWPRLLEDQRARAAEIVSLSIGTLEETISIAKIYSEQTLIFPSPGVRRAYRVTAVPETLLVNPEGKVSWAYYGLLSDDRYEDLIEHTVDCNAPGQMTSTTEERGSEALSSSARKEEVRA